MICVRSETEIGADLTILTFLCRENVIIMMILLGNVPNIFFGQITTELTY